MNQTAEKKGMSKGCLVGLIVGGVLLVIVILGVALTCVYKDDLLKMAAGEQIGQVKRTLVQDPVPGMDTVAFNAAADSFIIRMQHDSLDYDAYALFFKRIRELSADTLDSTKVVEIVEAMQEYFPDLEVPEVFPGAEESAPMDETEVTE